MQSGTSLSDPGSASGSSASSAVACETLPLVTVALEKRHRVDEFKCSRSARVERFFIDDWPQLNAAKYCKVFVLEDLDDNNGIVGYYTLSAAILEKSAYSNSDERRAPMGLSAPMVRIGFMGKRDGAPSGVGEMLIADAANRVSRISDLGISGIVLEPEGGLETRLAQFYQRQGFKKCRKVASMYALLKDLLAR